MWNIWDGIKLLLKSWGLVDVLSFLIISGLGKLNVVSCIIYVEDVYIGLIFIIGMFVIWLCIFIMVILFIWLMEWVWKWKSYYI